MQRLLLPLVAVGALVVAGCGDDYKDERGRGDAPVGDRVEEPRTVIFNVDRFPNLSIVCDGATAIYTNTRDAGSMVAIPTPSTAGKGHDDGDY